MKNEWICNTSTSGSYYECNLNGNRYFLESKDYRTDLSFDDNLEICKKKIIVDKLKGKENLYLSLLSFSKEISELSS